jgi:hypothetical protein
MHKQIEVLNLARKAFDLNNYLIPCSKEMYISSTKHDMGSKEMSLN